MPRIERWDHEAQIRAHETERRHKRAPTTGILLGVCGILVLIGTTLYDTLGADLAYGVLGLAALVAAIQILVNPMAGLGIYIMAVAVSPEFTVAGIDNIRVEDFILAMLLFSRLLRALQGTGAKGRFELMRPIIGLLFLSLVSTLNNAIVNGLGIASSLMFLAKTCTYYVIALCVYDMIQSRQDAKQLLWLTGIAGLTSAAWAVIYQPPEAIRDVGMRVMGPEGETGNIFAAYLVVNTIIMVALCMESRVSWHPWVGVPIFVLMTIPALFTFSRAGFVSLMTGFGVMTFAFHRRLVVGLLAFVLVFLSLAPERMMERVSTIGSVVSDQPTSSWAEKLTMWDRAMGSFVKHPLIGVGIAEMPMGALDNEFVKQAYELGILGVLVFLWMLFVILRQAVRLLRHATDPLYRGLAVGFFCALVAVVVNSISAPTFTAIRTGELFFFLTGLVFAVARMIGCDQEAYVQHGGYRFGSADADDAHDDDYGWPAPGPVSW